MSRERRHTTVSTHAPLAGSDDALPRHFLLDDGFNPRSPCGERPAKRRIADEFAMFQPTLPLRGATRLRQLPACGDVVSTHAPLAGSDLGCAVVYCHHHRFQPTLPLRGATRLGAVGGRKVRVSTHAPLAGSDDPPELGDDPAWDVSTHAPLAGSDLPARDPARRLAVSTHAPLAGSDGAIGRQAIGYHLFQPTLPLRGATRVHTGRQGRAGVSTHAPLAGSDLSVVPL